MAEKVSNKYSIFNKSIELSFPKGTVLQSANPGLNATQFYPDNKLLFGIADPNNGVVGKRDDYGNYIGRVHRITSYNVCYTKLLRSPLGRNNLTVWSEHREETLQGIRLQTICPWFIHSSNV